MNTLSILDEMWAQSMKSIQLTMSGYRLYFTAPEQRRGRGATAASMQLSSTTHLLNTAGTLTVGQFWRGVTQLGFCLPHFGWNNAAETVWIIQIWFACTNLFFFFFPKNHKLFWKNLIWHLRVSLCKPMGSILEVKPLLQMFLLSACHFPSGGQDMYIFFIVIIQEYKIQLSIPAAFWTLLNLLFFMTVLFQPDLISGSSDTDFSSQPSTSLRSLWCLTVRSHSLMCVQCKPMLFVYDELNRWPGGTEFTKQEIAWRGWIPGLSGGSRTLLSPLKRDLRTLSEEGSLRCFLLLSSLFFFLNSAPTLLRLHAVKVKPASASPGFDRKTNPLI